MDFVMLKVTTNISEVERMVSVGEITYGLTSEKKLVVYISRDNMRDEDDDTPITSFDISCAFNLLFNLEMVERRRDLGKEVKSILANDLANDEIKFQWIKRAVEKVMS